MDGFFMMNFHMVMEVIQKRTPAPVMVRMPGTHPKTLKESSCQLHETGTLTMVGRGCEGRRTRVTMSEP
jgi:hypothetical protein